MGVNIKELCKQIKKDSRKSLIWTLENGVHYISNRYWAVRFIGIPSEVSDTLFSIFDQMPSEGRTLATSHWDAKERPFVSMSGIFRHCESNNTEGSITNIIIEQGKVSYRVIKTNDHLIRIDNKYLSIVNKDKDIPKCSHQMTPVSFCNNQFLVISVRVTNSKEDDTINELLAV